MSITYINRINNNLTKNENYKNFYINNKYTQSFKQKHFKILQVGKYSILLVLAVG